MNVFILCTGRSGSTTFIKACKHADNFTASHESRVKELGASRLNYPENHIEGDNRLSWMLGELDEKYSNDAFYIHLTRDRAQTARSFNQRWNFKSSIIFAFAEGIKMRRYRRLSKDEKYQLCLDYYDTVNKNIQFFLKDKTQKMTIDLSDIKNGLIEFWEKAGVQGNIEEAVKELNVSHNATKKKGIFKKLFSK